MSRRPRGPRDGYILITVLAVAVMLTGLIAAGSLVMRSAIGSVRVEDAELAATGMLSSGVEIAAYQLAVLKIRPDLVDGRRVRLTGGTVTPHVVDEAGKVDLDTADPKLLLGVLKGIDMDDPTAATVVARIVALRGPLNGVMPGVAAPAGSGPAPGETGTTGSGAAPPPGGNAPPKRRGLQSVEDLRDIEGVRRSDMVLLRQRFTVYNPDGRVDLLTAAPDLLASIPGMTKLKLTQLLAARDSGSADALRDAQSALGGDMASFTKVLPGPAYTVRVDAVEKSGRKKSVEAVIAASKSPNQPYYILDWRE